MLLFTRASWLARGRVEPGDGDTTPEGDVVAMVARSSRSLRLRLRECRLHFTTPLDPGLLEADLGGGALAASAGELAALASEGAARRLDGIRVSEVDRMRAARAAALMATLAASPEDSEEGRSADAAPAPAAGRALLRADASRGLPSSSSSLLATRGMAACRLLLSLLLEAASPTAAMASPSPTAPGVAAPIPLSAFAVVDPNAGVGSGGAGIAAGAGGGAVRALAADRYTDLPQLLAAAPFAHASLQRNALTLSRDGRAAHIRGTLLPPMPACLQLAAGAACDDDDVTLTPDVDEHYYAADFGRTLTRALT